MNIINLRILTNDVIFIYVLKTILLIAIAIQETETVFEGCFWLQYQDYAACG